MGDPAAYGYLREPQAIYDKSFAIVRAEADFSGLPENLHDVAVRLIHACGMTDLPTDLAWGGDPVGLGSAALRRGAPILVDVMMVRHGIIDRLLPAGNQIICTLNTFGVEKTAKVRGDTRSAVAVEKWREDMEGAVVCIGNAPTALFRLLEMLGKGAPKPAVILGFPVGFVGAPESKQALIDDAGDVPYLTLRGRRGGSAIAAAAVNALARTTV
ncbi:MAG: precorrin-8X methylmutase [Alphaproteobacteria bacterium]|jgi:precorrin-8X/cobalt-precorrin-8 methylmutase|nr:precorrin-8X methylmutase [Alphaproteobacteria bacterium]MDP6831832.1 precorrin-8X methylmutase [Alphaproteobacteria bacterium]